MNYNFEKYEYHILTNIKEGKKFYLKLISGSIVECIKAFNYGEFYIEDEMFYIGRINNLIIINENGNVSLPKSFTVSEISEAPLELEVGKTYSTDYKPDPATYTIVSKVHDVYIGVNGSDESCSSIVMFNKDGTINYRNAQYIFKLVL